MVPNPLPVALPFAWEVANKFGKFFKPNESKNVRQSFYMDVFLAVARNCEAIQIGEEHAGNNGESGFNLTKWQSTSAQVIESLPNNCHRKVGYGQQSFGGENVMLGIKWSLEMDEFYFDSGALELNKPVTKHGLLAVTNSVYDPLVFLAPAILKAHLIYRNAC